MASKKKQQNLYSSTQNKLAQYEEKQRQHDIDQKRGSKDNRLALIAGAAALLIAVGAQFGYTALHPAPKASTAASPSASSTPEKGPSLILDSIPATATIARCIAACNQLLCFSSAER